MPASHTFYGGPHTPLASSQKHCITELLITGLTPQSIAAIEHISECYIRRIQSNLCLCSHHTMDCIGTLGPKKKLTSVIIESLQLFLQKFLFKYFDELQMFLYDEFKIWVDTATISKALKTTKIIKKIIKKITLKCSEICCNSYHRKIAQYTAEQIIAINESVIFEHTCFQQWGWTSSDIISFIHQPLYQSEHRSILPVYTVDEVLAHLI